MCGIAGGWALHEGQAPTSVDIRSMLAPMNYRGPDDSGTQTWKNGAVGMCRLSIIDLLDGHQPMSNEDGTVWVILNGEIYNFKELRLSLESTGRHTFRSQSDTEVLVHLYEEIGVEMVSRLNGMFAFCIVDVKKARLLLCRDRFGEKPLFYSLHGGAFWFASELGAILTVPKISRRASREALHDYLEDGFISGPKTAFEGISELPPGAWMTVEGGRVETGSWKQAFPPVDRTLRDQREIAASVRTHLLGAVQRQMVADVPIGAFLSGGIDSSAVVAAMQQISGRPVKTFTARFEHAPYDESGVARKVAEHLGTDHCEIAIPNSGFEPEDLHRIVRHVGQPFADSSAIPTYFVCREIKRHVKVCLSGDGGDEMFGGYSLFQWIRHCDRLAAVAPVAALKAAATGLGALTSTKLGQRLSVLRRGWRGLSTAASPSTHRLAVASRLFVDDELRALLLEPLRVRGIEQANGSSPHVDESRLRCLMRQRTDGSLPDDMLVKVDRMSMAASLEVRAPMLDAEVAVFASRLPDRFLIHAGVGKYILREAVKDWLPSAVFEHPKTGFSIPLHTFRNSTYEALSHDLLLSNRVPLVSQLFNKDALAALVVRGISQTKDTGERSVYRSSHQLWALMNLAAWADEFKVSL
jgi:asparagine synthase (glutamine-hydrolysing)